MLSHNRSWRTLCQLHSGIWILWVMPHCNFYPHLPLTYTFRSCTHAHMWHIPCMVLCWYSDGVVTLTSNVQGAICPGEEVILTCTVTGGVSLEWSSTAFRMVRFFENDPLDRPKERGIFTATLISEAANPTPPLADLTSSLRVNTTLEAMLNGTVVTCSDQINPVNITLTFAGVFIVVGN